MDPQRSTRPSQDPVWHQHSLLDRAEALEEEALFEDDSPAGRVRPAADP
jgi:hypothetical protein